MDSDSEIYDDEYFSDCDIDNLTITEDDGIDSFIVEKDNNSKTMKEKEESIYHYKVLTNEEIMKHMTECINDVNNVISIPATTTRVLLNHCKWNKDVLLERLFGPDQDKLFKDACVINPFNESSNLSELDDNVCCEICLLKVPADMITGLACGHRYCTECWIEYLTRKITEEGLGQSISCAAHKCDILVDDAIVMRLITDVDVLARYQLLITNSFVECNRQFRWCPSADCNKAVRMEMADSRLVTCTCGHSFCFECGENSHDPVMCRLLAKWLQKCRTDSETSNWIATNTKECPKCYTTIEKNGGCNHMTCKKENCKYQFCWICLGDWKSHNSNYKCNRFHEEGSQEARTAQEQRRAALARYLHYYNRYANHLQSLKLEDKLDESITMKMEEMQRNNTPWVEVIFLKEAVGLLQKSRQTLMYTYVFAYYLKKNNQQDLFEDNQTDLEKATEVLSEYLEREITTANLDDIKAKVLDKSSYCEMRRKVLCDHVYEGYLQGWWNYTETL